MPSELPRILTSRKARALGLSRAEVRHRLERGRWWRLAHDLVMGVGARTPPAGGALVLDRTGRHRQVGGVRIRPTPRPYTATVLPADHPTLAFVPLAHPARAIADTAMQHRSFVPSGPW